MFDFDGNAGGGGRVNLAGGGGRNRTRGAVEESRSDFVKRQHREREARERKRLREKAATEIQAVFRSYRCLKIAREAQRQIFDKRHSDISRVGAVLPADKKAKFIYLALVPMMRLFIFFFTPKLDAARLSAFRELLVYSSQQPAASNIIHLAVADDEAQRRSFLALFQKLLAAALRIGPPADAMRLFLAIKIALFEGPAEGRGPQHEQRAGAAVGHLLRRTDILVTLSSEVLPKAGDAQVAAQAAELSSLCCAGLEACSWADRQQPLVCLISAPRLGDMLCQSTAPAAKECLRRLVSLFPGVPDAAGFPALLNQVVEGLPRASWLLANLVSVLEGFLMPSGDLLAKILPLWLSWLCWAKERVSLMVTDSGSPSPLDRLNSGSFVRSLVLAIDKQNPEGLLPLCQLYFSAAGGTGDCQPPAEVIQTLAFATPLAERLFPMLVGMMRDPSIESVFETLGPPSFATPEAMRLRIFCAIYALQMQPMYDIEFFGPANPLRMEDVEVLTRFLNRLAYHFVVTMPNRGSLEPSAKALRTSLTSLVSLLYNRHCRKPILPGENAWVIPESRLLIRRAPVVDLGDDEDPDDAAMAAAGPPQGGEDDDDPMDVEDLAGDGGGAAQPSSTGRASPTGGAATSAPGAEQTLEAVLEEVPHVLPFSDRVQLLHNHIQNDQAQRRETRGPWAQAAMQRHQIRRNFLVEDGFAAFDGLTEEGGLRDVFRVEFIAEDGQPESGVDGGGLFKEFMVTLNRAMFDPSFGMFSETSDRTLYPSVSAYRLHDRAADLYSFLGKVVGKAIYEMFLLEAQFSRVFLNRLLGRTNEVDDVAALDKELHRNMLRIRESDDIESLDLTFSVSVSEMGHHEEIDLIPNGRNVPVTKDNLTRYFHLMANYKTNMQFQRQTAAFLRGLQCVVPLVWLKMFDPYELNILVSGSAQGFDVQDLRRNTNYSGGYVDDSPVIQWLWDILQNHMDPEDMGRFLMFVTSCSRAPLLGFKTLYPAFCVHRVPDGVRLPTASTCANLLKLPDYTSFEALKLKLTQAIRAEAGFDLS